MADSTAFGNLFSSVTGMGNPLTPGQQYANPFDPTKENQLIPWLYQQNQMDRAKLEDPQRTRELLSVFKEFDEERAIKAAKLQADRDKRAFQYQMMANLPNTINQIGSNLAQMTYNAPRLQILADIPDKMMQAYGSMPRINVPTFR
jgi:hypothetical protein